MALIDVSEVLSDPDFTDQIQVISRVPSVSSYGEASFTETVLNTFGCVQPASSKDIERLPEALRVNETSSFWFRGVITTSSTGLYSGVLVFQGKRYQVQSVSDWMNYGSGYSQGLCTTEVPAP